MQKSIFLIFILALTGACSTIKVTYDYDGSANFASYKTWAFTKEAEALPVDDINRNRILQAITNELAAKGFTQSDNPDVWIDLNIRAEQKQSATATSYPYGVGYGYRWGGGFSTTSIDVENYLEGTLFVDMIDVAKRQLVWQGRAVKTIDPDASSEKREVNINNAIKQVFTKYPPK